MGLGVKQDYEKAAYWFQTAAEQGNKVAQTKLSHCYKEGKEVKKDHKRANYWYKKSQE